jgi:hypothetical protein
MPTELSVFFNNIISNNLVYLVYSLGRPKRRWEDNIKMDIIEVGWGMNWIDLTEDRDRWRGLVNAVMSLLKNSGNFLIS